MYVCLCNGLRERDVKQAVSQGATTVARVYKAHDCKPQCGKCACQIRDIIGPKETRPGGIGGTLLSPER